VKRLRRLLAAVPRLARVFVLRADLLRHPFDLTRGMF